jgi:hypothetical protein
VTLSSCDPLGVCARFGLAIGIYRHDGVASCLLDEMSVRANHVRRVLKSGALWNADAFWLCLVTFFKLDRKEKLGGMRSLGL